MLEVTENRLNYAIIHHPDLNITIDGFLHYWSLGMYGNHIQLTFIDGDEVLISLNYVILTHKDLSEEKIES